MNSKLDTIRFQIANKTLLKYFVFHFKRKKTAKLFGSDKDNFIGKYLFNYHFNCKKPKSFNEWICFYKNNYHNELWEKCADKLGSKEFLKSLNLNEYIVKTYGIYKNSKEIDLDRLPNNFVLKTNHDCGTVFVCNKKTTNFKNVFQQLDLSLNSNYSKNNNEWVYKNINPLIFAEELLYPAKGYDSLVDFKIQTINGKYAFGYARQCSNGKDYYLLFDGDFSKKDCFYQSISNRYLLNMKKPEHFEEMIKIAELIGRNFKEIRVDFYITNKGIKIGELTFFTQSGHGVFTKNEYDYKYGAFFDNKSI